MLAGKRGDLRQGKALSHLSLKVKSIEPRMSSRIRVFARSGALKRIAGSTFTGNALCLRFGERYFRFMSPKRR